MLEFPLMFEKPVLLWALEDIPGFPGLYISPNELSLPAMNNGDSSCRNHNDPRRILPWQWLSPRFAEQRHFWTALGVKQPEYTGLLQPLSTMQLEEFDLDTQRRWRLCSSKELLRLERHLSQILSLIKKRYPLSFLTPLLAEVEGENFPWPSAYQYTASWKSHDEAKETVRVVRATFTLTITKLTYAASLLPSDWVENLMAHGELSHHEAYLLRSSSICQKTDRISGKSFNRVGIVVNVMSSTAASFLEQLASLIHQFSLPVWLYYGLKPSTSEHPWSAKFLPSLDEIDACRKSYETRSASRTTAEWDRAGELQSDDWGKDILFPSSLYSPVQTEMFPRAGGSTATDIAHIQQPQLITPTTSPLQSLTPSTLTWGNERYVVGRCIDNMTHRDPTTRQFPGETFDHFFATVDRENADRRQRMSLGETIGIEERADIHAQLTMPDSSHKCRVFEWYTEADGAYVRKLVSRGRWRETFQNSAVSQRRYDPVRNAFDICHALDPSAQLEDGGEWHISGDNCMDQTTDSHRHTSATGIAKLVVVPCSTTVSSTSGRVNDSPPAQIPSPPSDLPPITEIHISSANSYNGRHVPLPANLETQDSSSVLRSSCVPPKPSFSPRTSLSPHPYHPGPDRASHTRISPHLQSRPTPRSILGGISTVADQQVELPDDDRLVYQPQTLLTLKDFLIKRCGVQTDGIEDCVNYGEHQLIRMLGNMHETVPPEVSKNSRIFASALVKPEEHFTYPSPASADIVPRSPLGPPSLRRKDIIVKPVEDASGKQWYILLPRGHQYLDTTFVLCVCDPVSVNHLLRCNTIGPSVYELSRALLTWGIRFKTLHAIANPRLLLPAPSIPMFTSGYSLALGIRPHRYQFTMDDYRAYVTERGEVIQSYRGRAALLHGSLVWRLAHESYADEADVLRGPSSFPNRDDYMYLDNTHFVDDTLSADQIDVICGVYHVLGSRVEDGISGSAHRSWWPSLHTWEHSAMDRDCWSFRNERWFRGHLEKILNGSFQPLSVSEWRRTLARHSNASKNFHGHLRQLSIDSLQEVPLQFS